MGGNYGLTLWRLLSSRCLLLLGLWLFASRVWLWGPVFVVAEPVVVAAGRCCCCDVACRCWSRLCLLLAEPVAVVLAAGAWACVVVAEEPVCWRCACVAGPAALLVALATCCCCALFAVVPAVLFVGGACVVRGACCWRCPCVLVPLRLLVTLHLAVAAPVLDWACCLLNLLLFAELAVVAVADALHTLLVALRLAGSRCTCCSWLVAVETCAVASLLLLLDWRLHTLLLTLGLLLLAWCCWICCCCGACAVELVPLACILAGLVAGLSLLAPLLLRCNIGPFSATTVITGLFVVWLFASRADLHALHFNYHWGARATVASF